MKTKEKIIKERRLFLAKNRIEDWNDQDTKDCMDDYSDQTNAELIAANAELVKEVEELKKDKWIRVEDGKPKSTVTVLVFDAEQCSYHSGFFDNYYEGEPEWRSFETGNELNVTHWQPLPKNPKP